jgi:hypothetical protein
MENTCLHCDLPITWSEDWDGPVLVGYAWKHNHDASRRCDTENAHAEPWWAMFPHDGAIVSCKRCFALVETTNAESHIEWHRREELRL